jgi:hypothetical protein
MTLTDRALEAHAARTAEQSAEAAASRAVAQEQAVAETARIEKHLFDSTATLRTHAAEALVAFGAHTEASDWAPLNGDTTSCVVHSVDGIQFGCHVLFVGYVEQLIVGVRPAGSGDAFLPVSDLASLGAVLSQFPAPATAADPERTPAS